MFCYGVTVWVPPPIHFHMWKHQHRHETELGNGAFGRGLGHESGACERGLAPYRDRREKACFLFP